MTEECPYCEDEIVEGENVVQLIIYEHHPLHVDEFDEVTYHSSCFMEMFNGEGVVSKTSIIDGRVEKTDDGIRSTICISDPTPSEERILEGINDSSGWMERLRDEFVDIPDEIGDWPPAAKLVYRVVGERKELKKGEVVESTRLSSRTVDKHLNGLVDAGLVRVNSYEDGQTYQIVEG